MSDAQKIPLSRSLGGAMSSRSVDEIAKLGLAIPGHVVLASGPFVTVSFDLSDANLHQVTMPVAGSEYVRLPLQPGDPGMAVPCAFYLGGASGLGGGVADTTRRGNLSTLVWQPIGNADWQAVSSGYAVVYGPNGVSVRDKASTAQVLVSAGNISLAAGGHTVTINSAGVTIDGVLFAAHEHLPGTYVADGFPVAGLSGAVNP